MATLGELIEIIQPFWERQMAQYKFKCRPCPPHIRRQCIQEAHVSPAAKRIIIQSFEARTDTQATWDLLQHNCLLVRRENMPTIAPVSRKGGLRDRLFGPEPPPAQEDKASQQPPPSQQLPVVKPYQPRSPAAEPTTSQPTTQTVSQTRFIRTQRPADRARTPTPRTVHLPRPQTPVSKAPILRYPRARQPHVVANEQPGPRILVSQVIGHRISLPTDGELVLGRFDPFTKIKPDIDLTFEDRITRGISRRHAQVIGWQGHYAIKDLGSTFGTWVNDKRLSLEQKQPLRIGDMIRLGNCVLFLDRPPNLWKTPLSLERCFFYSTFSGQYLAIPAKPAIVIGRADAGLGFKPDIDLGAEEEAASAVSRRHARLLWRNGQLVVQDLGSTQHTAIDGRQVPIGAKTPILPGQHLWLGGYTIAFDMVE